MRATVRYCARFLIPALLALQPVLAEAGGAFVVKGGSMRLGDSTQTVDYTQLVLDDNSNRALAFNIEGRKANGIALGGEFLSYYHDFNASGGRTGSAETQVVQFLAKKYFIADGPLHPYLGVGLGLGHTYAHSAGLVSDIEFTLAIQALAGLELRFDNISLQAEVKHLYHDVQSGDNNYNPTATGVFIGMGFNW